MTSASSMTAVPLSVPEIRGNEWAYLKECLDTNFVSSVGPFVDRFERMVADYVGARFAVATSSGTAALHVALLVAGVEADDEVLLSTVSFIAPANAVRYLGAWPAFVDAEPRYWELDVEKLVDFLERGCDWKNGRLVDRRTGRRVKAIVPVHILGHPCDMDPVLEAAAHFGLAVVNDATECLGARYRGRPVATLGDASCLSFNGNKLITTGGGGMIVTDNEALARRAKHLTTQAKADALEYIHDEIGFNYRLTNLQAAVGCAQMEQLDAFIATKRRIAETYARALADVPGVTPPSEAPWASSTFWLWTALVDAQAYGLDSRALIARLAAERIEARPLWQPLHMSPAHKASGPGACPVAEDLYRRALSLPCSVGLSAADQERVIATVRGACAR